MKIINLKSKNVLRLDAVEITPNGNTVIIGGENAQGKSSVLDSILLAIGGRAAKHKQPLKNGKKSGAVVCETDDFIVTRSFSKLGSTLKVQGKDGKTFSSPQKMLDKLTSSLTFDPLAWSRMGDAEQVDTLKKLVGLDFADLDKKRAELYSERTGVNSIGKQLKARYDAMPDYGDIPEEEIKIDDIMSELEKAQENNSKVEAAKTKIEIMESQVKSKENILKDTAESIEACEREIERLKKEQGEVMEEIKDINELIDGKKDFIESTPLIDTMELKEQINSVSESNRQIRAAQEKRQLGEELEAKRKESQALTLSITDIDEQKENILTETKFPIPELSFDEDGILFKGVPFSQASSAEQLRVSVGMGIAMNPELKVLLIRDGSLLDESNLKTIAEMAEKADAQVWIERVGKGEECQVIIEDGKIAE